MTDERSKQALK